MTLNHSQKGFILGDAGAIVGNVTFRNEFKSLAFWEANLRSDADGDIPFEFTAPQGLTSYRVLAVAQKDSEQFGHGDCLLRLAKRLQVEPVLPSFLRNGDEIFLSTVVRQDCVDSDAIDVAITVTPGIELAEPAVKRVKAKRGEAVTVGFRATVGPNATEAKIGFAAKLVGQPDIKDGEKNHFAIHPPTIERHETISGTFATADAFTLTTVSPPAWLHAEGRCDLLISGSQFLPKLAGLPAMLEAQGSTEKLATRILAATIFTSTLDTLPLRADSANELRSKVQDALKRFAESFMGNEGLPAWAGEDKRYQTRDDFATIEAAWAILSAKNKGYELDENLTAAAQGWLHDILRQEEPFADVSPLARCFALMVYGTVFGENTEIGESEAQDLFDNREELELGIDGRAWLALGMHYLNVLSQRQDELLREIDQPLNESAFDPVLFSSKTRSEALRLLAQSEIEAASWSDATRKRAVEAFDGITRSSVDLSTQENLWLLLALNSLARADVPAAMARRPLSPKPTAISKDRICVGWLDIPLDKLQAKFPQPLRPGVPGSYLINAIYRRSTLDSVAVSAGLSVERTARDVTDPSRTGAEQAPWKPGDLILVSYHLSTDRPHSYLELEDQLPACLETINPKLPHVTENFPLPIEAGVNTLKLSHVELRFARTLLYFQNAPPGRNAYSVLCRVIVPGVFRWPATQARPMYDSRFSGISESMVVHVQ